MLSINQYGFSPCSGEFDDDIEAMTFTKGKVEGLIAHEQYEIETRGGVSSIMWLSFVQVDNVTGIKLNDLYFCGS